MANNRRLKPKGEREREKIAEEKREGSLPCDTRMSLRLTLTLRASGKTTVSVNGRMPGVLASGRLPALCSPAAGTGARSCGSDVSALRPVFMSRVGTRF